MTHIDTDKSGFAGGRGWYISNSVGMPCAYPVRPETISQFTGLTDKNGKEIYESDVVTIRDRDGNWEIRIHPRYGIGFWKGNWELGDDNDASDPVYIDWHGITVIGNIYENPDLLTDSNASGEAAPNN